MALGMVGSPKGESFNRKIDAAERLLVAVRKGDTQDGLRIRILDSMPAGQRKNAAELVRQLPFNELRITLRACLAKTYTLEELNALARFYESSAGQSILKKDSTLFVNLVPMLHKELVRIGAQQEWTSIYPDDDAAVFEGSTEHDD